VEIAHYGPLPLDVSIAAWQILNSANAVVAEGSFAEPTFPSAKNFPLGNITADSRNCPRRPSIRSACHRKPLMCAPDWSACCAVSTTGISGCIRHPATCAPIVNFLATSSVDDAIKALADGKKVLFTPRLADLSWNSPPLARVDFLNALMGPTWGRMLGLWCDTNSPALAEFPTEANCDWQWTELVRSARAINLDQLPRGLTPMVSAIDDWNRNYKLGVIFEAASGAGNCSSARWIWTRGRRATVATLADGLHGG